jgi:hypothetical protein
MTDLLLFLITVLPLLAYVAKDIGAHWEKEKAIAQETWSRTITISIMVAFYSAALYLVISEVSSYAASPLLEEPNLSILWLVSNIILIVLAARHYHGARDTLRREEETKVEVANYVDQQLAGRLRPLEAVLAGVQAGMSELSGKISELGPEVKRMAEYAEVFANTILTQTKQLSKISERFEMREAGYREIAVQYDKWYSKRTEADTELKDLVIEAEDMLVRCDIIIDQMDELIDSGMVGPGSSGSGVAGRGEVGGVPQGQGAGQTLPDPLATGEIPAPSGGGKLTKEKGIANRERGNNAQLKFAEEILRGAGKLFDNSIKEATPDYVFYGPGTRNAKAVGAFKALTLKEDETRQRWIPRRKVLAELRLAMKYGVPLILFVQNFVNGRIWATIVKVNELKEFTGLTTPLWLVENDSQAEKACKETLNLALELL